MTPARLVAAAVAVALLGLTGCAAGAPAPAARVASTAPQPVPTFAYVDASGAASDMAPGAARDAAPDAASGAGLDAASTRRWMHAAGAAGIDGFIVRWRHAPGPDRRLARIVAAARAEHAHLGVVYRAVDGRGRALPAGAVAGGVAWFAARYARDPVFAYFDRPLVVWAGIDRYPTAAVARVSARVRHRVLLLASVTDDGDYLRLRDHVDGDAPDPAAVGAAAPADHAGLAALARAVRDRGGLWIPAAAGGGALADQIAAARDSGPDAVTLAAGSGATLRTVAALLGARVNVTDSPDSSSPGGGSGLAGPVAVGVIGALLVGGTGLLALRHRLPGPWRRRRGPADPRAADRPAG